MIINHFVTAFLFSTKLLVKYLFDYKEYNVGIWRESCIATITVKKSKVEVHIYEKTDLLLGF